MKAVEATILSEVERSNGFNSALIIVGTASEEGTEIRELLPSSSEITGAMNLLECDPNEVGHHDLVIVMPHVVKHDIERRSLGHAVAAIATGLVISIQSLGDELPVPLIELRRGLLIDDHDLGYRVYGSWSSGQ